MLRFEPLPCAHSMDSGSCCGMDRQQSKILQGLLSSLSSGGGLFPPMPQYRASPSYYCPSPAGSSRSSCSPMQPDAIDPLQTKLYAMLKAQTPPPSPIECRGEEMYASAPLKRSAPRTDDQPMDLSCKRPRLSVPKSNEPALPSSSQQDSILRNVLCGRTQDKSSEASPVPSASPILFSQLMGGGDRRSPATARDSTPPPSRRVTLAKKNMLPVSARVSDWIVKSVTFLKLCPDFQNLSSVQRMALLRGAWTKLVLLDMAETNFHFVVTPHTSSQDVDDVMLGPEVPTMERVEGIQAFIRKCQSLGADYHEYQLLRLLVAFHTGYAGLDGCEAVERTCTKTRLTLQHHVRSSRPDERLRYSQLLMCLNTLFSVDSKMVENLFCKHITDNTDMDVVLKEMLNSH